MPVTAIRGETCSCRASPAGQSAEGPRVFAGHSGATGRRSCDESASAGHGALCRTQRFGERHAPAAPLRLDNRREGPRVLAGHSGAMARRSHDESALAGHGALCRSQRFGERHAPAAPLRLDNRREGPCVLAGHSGATGRRSCDESALAGHGALCRSQRFGERHAPAAPLRLGNRRKGRASLPVTAGLRGT